MFGKVEILLVIIVLLLAFYFVISWGAGKEAKILLLLLKLARYLFGVRILIVIYCHSFANFVVIIINMKFRTNLIV